MHTMHPGLVQKIYDEGHGIGSHTFSHDNVLNAEEFRCLEFELNSTQRIIQGIMEQSTVLFRPPFLSINKGKGKISHQQKTLDKMVKIQNMGYTIVGSSIDPEDWDGKSADEIFKEVTTNSSKW